MASSLIAQKYYNSVQNNKIKASVLLKLPKLVSCPHWDQVEVLGTVHYQTQTKTLYKGALIHWDSGLYFISDKVLIALQAYHKKFKKINNEIQIIS